MDDDLKLRITIVAFTPNITKKLCYYHTNLFAAMRGSKLDKDAYHVCTEERKLSLNVCLFAY